MKTTKRIITSVIIIFYSTFCYTQMADVTPSQEIHGSPFIFEGNVIRQECYYGKHKEILTCSIMQITKIFKGSPQIKIGTIKVITQQGGRIGNNTDRPSDIGAAVDKGNYYIVLGKTADSTILHPMQTDNDITVDISDCVTFSFIGQGAAIWDGVRYKSLNDLYSVFKANGLRVQEEAEQK